jgi:tetratricopeptide (TPR) repeat protein
VRRESTTSRRSAYPQGVAAADPDDLLATGSAALAAGQWAGARAAFEDALAREPTAEAHAGLADVLWWVGETQASVQHHERAYAAFRHRDDLPNAAMGAVGLYLTYRASLGRTAVARGWLARAARMVEEAGLAPLAGWVALLRAHDSADAVAAERWATEAREAAGRYGDADLELCALSQLGAALVQQGRREEGTTLLDEAMAAALAGEARRPHTVVYASCNLVTSCAQTAELAHALQWIHAKSYELTHPVVGTVTVRDQKPLQLHNLELTDVTIEAFLELLNNRVFMWTSRERLSRLLGARPYRMSVHDVLVLDTAGIVDAYSDSIRLTSINTGATIFPTAPPRGTESFMTIADFPFTERRRGRRLEDTVVELCVIGGVDNVEDFVIRVERRKGADVIETVYER